MPIVNPPQDTIDITDLVEKLRSSFVEWGVTFILAAISAVPYLQWLKLPVIRQLFRWILTKLLKIISHAIEMQAFFLNTAIRKSGQAHDFTSAVNALNNLPPTATEEEYAAYEQKRMDAFRNFVLMVN